jgi:uncharacterized protein
MSHTIKKIYRSTTPTGLYEANYRRFVRLIANLAMLEVNHTSNLSASGLMITILEQHKYTTIVSLNQNLISQAVVSLSIPLSAIDMDLRVCHDACLVEVISYQGKGPIQSALSYPNKDMLQIDEKKQLNLLLKDILDTSLKNEYHPVYSI